MIDAPIKMVIWDLDDTLWQGTLGEGAVVLPEAHVEIVETLSRRGIVSSICSKNSYVDARQVLESKGLWELFVFPRIAYANKGAIIRELIGSANLRPPNVLFIDDNRLNLEEARHFVPGLMTAHPSDIVPTLLDHPQARGKPDPDRARLRHYKVLERKLEERQACTAGAEEFLRACDIRVSIDIDVEPQLERIIELINRSNQLNFTKTRINTEEERNAFAQSLKRYGMHAGIVSASDKYGDYGVVGFFLMRKRTGSCELVHFVFSCRVMNMGIEQYIHEVLGKPGCNIVPPVANGLRSFPRVDWISAPEREKGIMHPVSDAKLLLLGGCDLMQVATYCSSNRVEYVNRVTDEVMVRYDDPGFILSPRDATVASDQLPGLPCWTGRDTLAFDQDLADSKIIVVSMWEALKGDFILLDERILLRLAPRFLGAYFRLFPDKVRLANSRILRLTKRQKLELIERSLERIAQLSVAARNRFLLGVTTHRTKKYERDCRREFNRYVQAYCERNPAFEFVPVDEIVPKDQYTDGSHLTRNGYFAIASELSRRMAAAPLPTASDRALQVPAAPGFQDIVQGARVVQYKKLPAYIMRMAE